MSTCAGPLVLLTHTGQVSGAEVVLLGLVELALSRGERVVLASPPGPLTARLPAGVRHVELPHLGLGSGPRLLRPAALAARSAVAARRIRTALGPAGRLVVNSLLALPAARLARPPGGAVWLVHDTVHRRDQRWVVRAGAKVLRRAVAVSEATAAPLRALGLVVTVAQNGVAWPVDPVGVDVHTPPVVGALALLTPWKGHLVLLDALALLPGVRLELGGGQFPGDAAHVAALHDRAGRPDLAGRVRFLGHVDPVPTMRGWDVAVSASTSPEAGPISVLQAMSMGVPLVGTDHGGTSEFLGDGAGLLVPPGDARALAEAVHRLLVQPELRAAVAAVARARVAEAHDLDRTRTAMLDAVVRP